MSTRIEWTDAESTGVAVLERGDEAADGGTVTKDACLLIGALAVEGTVDEIMFVLAKAAASLTGPLPDADPEDTKDLVYARGTRNMLLSGLSTHEIQQHDGDACADHRTGIFAFLAHSAGFRPEHLAPVAVELADYNLRHEHLHNGSNGHHHHT